MSVRPDNRLRDAPMTPITCLSCGAHVLVRKSSWEQTSVQWNAASRSKCTVPSSYSPRRLRGCGDTGGAGLLVCQQLRMSIEAAVRNGSLPVLDEL
ncbi:hypothetical protein [Mycobacterium sp. 852013-50091_SCH5140682]|uniref:hypothetical protein n=1 Tax=unclassified Mycolicibacterium TaxID=2636767 RepID=UPI0009ECCB2B|nr:hypothetical protein [Mycobacterium sp. 852013-50091_SCH5140682]